MASDMDRPPGEHRDEQEKEEFARDDREPHHELNNPVGEPDPTEWPDSYEKRPDPRGPSDPDSDDPPAPAPAPPSTSEPPPERNPDVEIRDHRGDHRGG